jgi:catechol 2,3-dioxygenase-like lactoylglutathione lyase family enzyme
MLGSGEARAAPLIRKVDCVGLPVADLAEALAFYCDRLGHELIWRSPSAMGLRLPDSTAELVLHTEGRPPEVDLAVDSVTEAVQRFQGAVAGCYPARSTSRLASARSWPIPGVTS